MIINKVVLNNFFCFVGINVLEFEKGLNIISAPNSGGKSHLFNAFYWTFFNRIYLDNSAGKKEWKSSNSIIVCPDKLKKESNPGDKIISYIEITLTDEYHFNDEPIGDLVEYNFLKKVVYEKIGPSLSVSSSPELIISFVKDGETQYILNHQKDWFLERIFPSSMRKFMWYQGETVDELYDFTNPNTLKNAIREISYFPMYDNMEKIVKASSLSIEKKIEKELGALNKLSNYQQKLIADINYATQNIEKKEGQILELRNDIEKLQDDIASEEHKLKGYDKYRDLKEKIFQLQSELNSTKIRIEDFDVYIKETLINKWMLNGCESLIKESEKNLTTINKEIQEHQKTNNPVPMSLPGPEYVEKMLADHMCYICEREVLDETPEYEALKKRLNDFEDNANFKILQDNYTELNRARKRLISELPEIKDEIVKKNKERDVLIKKRNSINNKIKSLYDESGNEDSAKIIIGASTASQILSKIQSYRASITTKTNSLNYIASGLIEQKEALAKSIIERDNIIKNIDVNIIENSASNYIKMFVKSIGKLRSIAYTKLISEIQQESNTLYSKYLGGKPQGEIVINNGIRIFDKGTKEVLSDLNTAELVAQKLAVANAFLSLSEKKMERSYPIVADAPTSDFDHDNTYNLTINIGGSFDQMIIMSKDYAAIKGNKREDLIKEAKIVKFYEFKNDLIDLDGLDSRTNKKTYITTIK